MFGVKARTGEEAEVKRGLLQSLRDGLHRTRESLLGGLSSLLPAGRVIDATTLDGVEECLLLADAGVEATSELMERLRARHRRARLPDSETLYGALREEMIALLEPVAVPLRIPERLDSPYVLLLVGVNGAGKTTTLAKLAGRFIEQGRDVILAAGDTFRAAAVAQLQVWGERLKVPVISQKAGADAASVIYDALAAAKARGAEVLIADTAGRLHTRENLMEELKKIRRVLTKLDATAPHEVLLVLDATTGQNALAQAEQFKAAVGASGIALTKMDGTARGGILFAIARHLAIPIRFLGVGEQAEDLREFNAAEFVDALLGNRPGGR